MLAGEGRISRHHLQGSVSCKDKNFSRKWGFEPRYALALLFAIVWLWEKPNPAELELCHDSLAVVRQATDFEFSLDFCCSLLDAGCSLQISGWDCPYLDLDL